MEFNFMLQIVADIDERTKEVIIKKIIPINTSVEGTGYLTREISETEARYGILTLGKEAKTIGMTTATRIMILIDNEVFKDGAMTHKATVGRIDGMTTAYSEKRLNSGDMIEVRYDIEERILRINHVAAEEF